MIVVDADETFDLNVDSYFALLSFPDISPDCLNLYVPAPTDVEPNPTIFDLH